MTIPMLFSILAPIVAWMAGTAPGTHVNVTCCSPAASKLSRTPIQRMIVISLNMQSTLYSRARSLRLLGLVLTVFLLLAAAAAQRAKHPSTPGPAPVLAHPKPCPLPGSEEQIRRLIMKDGSYQPVTKCEIVGDRVRYLSAERYEWEDIPTSLIDWAASEQYAKQAPIQKASPDVAAVDAEEAAERKKEAEKSPEVAPGLQLPSQGGIFLMDIYRDNPELLELVQSGGEVNQNRAKNVLRAAVNPLAKTKQTIELKGAHAPVQAHVPQPAIYVNIDMDQDPTTGAAAKDYSEHFRIVRCAPRKDARVVGAIEVAIYGKVSQKANYVPTAAQPFTSEWIKVTPAQPLEPGEYALVEMLGKDVNMYVWDFGVNPTAPENAGAWKPAPVANTTTGTKETPVLNKRPPKD